MSWIKDQGKHVESTSGHIADTNPARRVKSPAQNQYGKKMLLLMSPVPPGKINRRNECRSVILFKQEAWFDQPILANQAFFSLANQIEREAFYFSLTWRQKTAAMGKTSHQ